MRLKKIDIIMVKDSFFQRSQAKAFLIQNTSFTFEGILLLSELNLPGFASVKMMIMPSTVKILR